MHPILFNLGPLTIYSYGLMVGLGFVIATILAAKQAGRYGISQERITTLSLVILIAGVAGGRVLYVILNRAYFISNPLECFMITRGGLVFYGGAAFAFLASVIYVKRARLAVMGTADVLAPFIPLGHAIGRIGCLLNGCCYGEAASGFFGVVFQDGVVRIPTQIYSSFYLMLLYVLLKSLLKARRFTGEVFFSYLILYSAGRFFIEFLRADSTLVIGSLRFSQVVSIIIFAGGTLGYFFNATRSSWNRTRSS